MISSVGANSSLHGKCGIIIGASRGIGAAAARLMASLGARLVLVSRDEAALGALVQSIRSDGGEADFFVADVSDLAALDQAMKAAVDALGVVNVSVNNAGMPHATMPFHELPMELFDRCLNLNVKSVAYAMQLQVRHMMENGGGSIINVGSLASLRGLPKFGAYAASKHGTLALTRCVASEYATFNIRANLVAPGGVLTDMFRKGSGGTPEGRAAVEALTPLGRIGQPDEIAQAIAWLASDASSYVTGVALPVDGGMAM